MRSALVLVLLAACTQGPYDLPTEGGPVAAGAKCNPLATEWDCFYPYPSNFYLKKDATLPGGVRVEFPGDTLPTFIDPSGTTPIDFTLLHPADGFSVLPQIGALIPNLDNANLVFHTGDVAASLLASSPTQLLDAETGERIVHFAEIDPRPDDVNDRALLLRPLVRLKNGHRYVVALHLLKTKDGKDVGAPGGFGRIRDASPDGDLERHFAGYFEEKIFPVTTKAGLDRASLVLAWDFTIESEAHVAGDMLEVRRAAMAAFDAAPPKVRIESVAQESLENGEWIGREIKGFLTVPNYLQRNAKGEVETGALLHRGADGKPSADGTLEARFTVRIPRKLLDDPASRPGRVLEYGHGFFGGHTEIKNSYISKLQQEYGLVFLSTDWMGMASVDAAQLFLDLLSAPSQAMRFVDRVHQGMVNFIALDYAARLVLPNMPEFRKDDAALLDEKQLYYFGISQGHILGSTFMALSPGIDRAVLNVGGAGFGFMMSRAAPFSSYLGALESASGDASPDPARSKASRKSVLKLVMVLQTIMDRIDPITFSPYLLERPLPGNKAKKLLVQIGIGDSQVPNMASHLQARVLGLPLLQPAVRPIYGLTPTEGPIEGSAFAEYDLGVAPPDIEARPVTQETPVHEGVRRIVAGQKQLDAFLRPDGKATNFCDGKCDPE